MFWAYKKFKQAEKDKKDGKLIAFGVLEALVGVTLVIGLFTQLAALVASIIFLVHLLRKIKNKAFQLRTQEARSWLFVLRISLDFVSLEFSLGFGVLKFGIFRQTW